MQNEPMPTAGHWNIMDIYSPGKKVHHVSTGGACTPTEVDTAFTDGGPPP